MKNLPVYLILMALVSCSIPSGMELTGDSGWTSRREYGDFEISGQARASEGAVAAVRFCISGEAGGYEVLFHNGPTDGSLKTGSLSTSAIYTVLWRRTESGSTSTSPYAGRTSAYA